MSDSNQRRLRDAASGPGTLISEGCKIEGLMTGGEGADAGTSIWTAEFWKELGAALWAVGGELWLGGLVIGVVTGALAYVATYYGVQVYRRARGA